MKAVLPSSTFGTPSAEGYTVGQLIGLVRPASPVGGGVSVAGRLRDVLAAVLERLHAPALIRPFSYDDPTTGQHVELRTSSRYAVLSVNGRDYFFNRESGTLDGAGSGVSGDACEHSL